MANIVCMHFEKLSAFLEVPSITTSSDAVLSAQGIPTSPKYVRDLMQEMGLQSITRYSKRDYQKGKLLAKKQNLLQRQFQADEPNRVWVSDVTCSKINDKYLYVCAILDLFSRKVVAYRVSPKYSTYLITSTFRQAFQLEILLSL